MKWLTGFSVCFQMFSVALLLFEKEGLKERIGFFFFLVWMNQGLFVFSSSSPQVALHACGVATDMVMEHCIQADAAFVISPCCYGFIQNAIKFTFPKRFVPAHLLSWSSAVLNVSWSDFVLLVCVLLCSYILILIFWNVNFYLSVSVAALVFIVTDMHTHTVSCHCFFFLFTLSLLSSAVTHRLCERLCPSPVRS